MRRVAALCVSPTSHYKREPGVECFDERRDVRTFAGGMPVVAHPPCRAWSLRTSHQAKPVSGEKELGPLCVEWLRKCGGVLEHPAHSRLFGQCGLPRPGQRAGELFTVGVRQSWFGCFMPKSTWLCFCGVEPSAIQLPYALDADADFERLWQLSSRSKRSLSTPQFVRFLVDAARLSLKVEVAG